MRDYRLEWGAGSRAVGFMQFEEPIKTFEQVTIVRSSIGAFSYLGRETIVHESSIGRYCSIGSRCTIAPSMHPRDRLTSSLVTYHPLFDFFRSNEALAEDYPGKHIPVTVGHDVWIGNDVTLMDGVSIGHGAIIGTGAVVTRDVAPYTVVGGVPAKPIRPRFSDDIVARLLTLQWWRYDLLEWAQAGTLPRMTAVDHPMLDAMEAVILDGKAPRISGRRCRVEFTGSTPHYRALDD